MDNKSNYFVESAHKLITTFLTLHSSLKLICDSLRTPPIQTTPIAPVAKQDIDEIEVLTLDQDWRKICSQMLSGRGLEIGPLQKPMTTHSGMTMEYIDRFTVANLRAQYPELNSLPLVEPNIIGDAETLAPVPNDSYDFLIAAHVVEHMKNPIGALSHWLRVIKPGGLLYLVVPDKRITFDYHRARTSLAHIILDYKNPSAERDFEHYLDFAFSPRNKTGEAAIQEAKDMVKTDYSIHFHTFIPSDVVHLLTWFTENIFPVHTIVGPAKVPGSEEFHFVLKKPLAGRGQSEFLQRCDLPP